MSGIKTYYWDSCIFLTLAKNEEPDKVKNIKFYFEECNAGNIKIITSVLSLVEVYHLDDVSEDEKQRVDDFFQEIKNVQRIPMNVAIAERSAKLRQHFRLENIQGKTLSAPDAIHLATAELSGADEFHTYDSDNSKTLGLLQLNGRMPNSSILIIEPNSDRLL